MDKSMLIKELANQYGYPEKEAKEIIDSYQKSDKYEFLCDFLLAKISCSAKSE